MLDPRPAGLTLEELLSALADSGRLTQLNLVRTSEGNGYQCSLQRPGTVRFHVSVRKTAVEAIFEACGPHASQTWEDHLGVEPGQLSTGPFTTYWHHPESDNLFTLSPNAPYPKDPLCEQLSKEEYDKLIEIAEDWSHLV